VKKIREHTEMKVKSCMGIAKENLFPGLSSSESLLSSQPLRGRSRPSRIGFMSFRQAGERNAYVKINMNDIVLILGSWFLELENLFFLWNKI